LHQANKFNTPEKCKAYLRAHDIEYDEDAPTTHLRSLAQRRARRLEREAFGTAERQAIYTEKKGVPLAEVRRRLEEMRVDGEDKQSWIQANFIIEDFADHDIVVLKHEVGKEVRCRGLIKGGQCKRCEQFVPGILAYSFVLEIRDVVKDSCRLMIRCTDGAGDCLFGMDAANFNALTTVEKEDAKEKIILMKYGALLNCTYTKEKNDIFVHASNCVHIPHTPDHRKDDDDDSGDH
jgi:hypothetical protein